MRAKVPKLERCTTLDRIAGKAELRITVEKDRVLDVELRARGPVRGFETLVKGKSFIFATEAVMRICGVCHAAHAIAFCEAVESALSIKPPRDGLLLREACNLANRVQSHLLQHLLVAHDLLIPQVLSPLQTEILQALEKASSLMGILGGAPTHPPFMVVGGMSKAPAKAAIEKAQQILDELQPQLTSIAEAFCLSNLNDEVARALSEVKFKGPLLTTDLFYGDATRLNIKVVETLESMGNALYALYDGQSAETGPRARMQVFKGFSDRSLLGLQLARAQEMLLVAQRLGEILNEFDQEAPIRAREIPLKAGWGVGVCEAPRGTLLHFVEMDSEGCVSSLGIVVPTMFNMAAIKEALLGLEIEFVEVAIRIYDPCMPCAVHLQEIKGS